MQNNQPSRYKTGKGDLTRGPITGHLTRLSIPMTWGIMAIISFQLVDMYFIAQLPGTEDLTAVSFTFPITMLIFSFIIGFGIAMSSVISRLIGEGQDDIVRRVATHGLILVGIVSIIISALGIGLMDTLFGLMMSESDRAVMLPRIRDYMLIWFAGAIFVSIPVVGNAAMRAGGDSMTPAIIMTIIAVINTILDPIFIFGLFGFPRLELQGAALTTVFSNGLAMVAGIWVLGRKKKMLCPKSALNFKKFGDSAKRLLFIALPIGSVNSIQPMVNAFIITLLAKINTDAVAAFGIATRVEAFAFIILMGVAVGMAPIIGQNWGAQKYDRVLETLRKAIGFCVIWSVLVAIVLGVFAKSIAGLFEQDADIIHYATLFFWIVPFSYIFANLIRGWASAFNAMGYPQRSVIMIIVEMIFMMLPAVYIGQHFGGVMGIFIAMAAVNTLAGAAFHIIWSRKIKKACAEKSTPL